MVDLKYVSEVYFGDILNVHYSIYIYVYIYIYIYIYIYFHGDSCHVRFNTENHQQTICP